MKGVIFPGKVRALVGSSFEALSMSEDISQAGSHPAVHFV